jgi:F0F1-type ATP synthase assembly protein I
MADKTSSTITALRIASILASLVAIGLLVAILMDKTDLPAPIPLMLLVAGLALSIVASAKAKNGAPKP